MSFSVKVVSVEGVEDFEAIQFSIGDNKAAVGLNEDASFEVGEDPLQLRFLGADEEELAFANIDLEDVEDDAWVNLSNGGRAHLALSVEDVADADADADADDVPAPAAAPASFGGGFDDDMFGGAPATAPAGGFDFDAPAPSASSASPASSQPAPEPVPAEDAAPTPLQIWQEKHNKELVERAQASRAKRDERKEHARGYLAKFYEDRDKKIDAKKTLNKQHQKTMEEQIEFNLGLGSVWERVTNLCNMSSNASKKTDVSRIRSVLLHVKNNTPAHLAKFDGAKAVAAGGASSKASSSSEDFF